MVRAFWPTAYKDVARIFVHHTRTPLGRRHPDKLKCAVVLEAVKDKPCGWRYRAILDRFCARRRLERVGRDEETGCPRSNKETDVKKIR